MQTTSQSGQGQSNQVPTIDQINTWLRSASPSDLIIATKSLTNRLSTLDQSAQDKFTQTISKDPTVSKLFKSDVVA